MAGSSTTESASSGGFTPTAEHTVHISAPPQRVWDLVTNVTRTPEWSPACYRVEWIEPGRRFRGYNKLNGARWSRECEITTSEAPEVFAFSTVFKGRESTRWRYVLEPAGGGTTLTEAYQIVSMPLWVRVARALPGAGKKTERDTRRNLEQSVAGIKRLAEATGS
jgi:uncharacterized protein YndB with AHSA1/START domain